MKPKFSIIITTYNRSGLLVRALNSLIAQKFKNWEGIIIDDGSTDDTSVVVQPFINKYKNLHYFRQENRGEAGAKNRGILLSCGEYLSFLDSDDEYAPDHLDSRNNILENHPEVELLHGGVKIIGDQFVPDKKNPGKMIHLSDCKIGGTFFIKKEVIDKLGGFRDLKIGTDSEWFENAKNAGLKIFKTDIPTYVYHRTSQDSITHKFQNKIFQE